MKIKDLFQVEPTGKLKRVIRRFKIMEPEVSPKMQDPVITDYVARLVVMTQFSCRDEDYQFAAENAIKMCIHALYEDFVSFQLNMRQALYEEDYNECQRLMDEFFAEIINWKL